MRDRTSYLVNTVAEDAVYVVGYFADIRGLRVSIERTKFEKTEIVLRIQVEDEREPGLPGPGQLHFDQTRREYESVD